MQTFIVTLNNRPGELARVTEAIATKGIDITTLAGVTCGGDGAIALLTNDEAATRRALADAKCDVRELELVSASIPNRPGELAKVVRRLADAGVNIEAALPVGMTGGNVTVAFGTSDAARARSAIGETVHAASNA